MPQLLRNGLKRYLLILIKVAAVRIKFWPLVRTTSGIVKSEVLQICTFNAYAKSTVTILFRCSVNYVVFLNCTKQVVSEANLDRSLAFLTMEVTYSTCSPATELSHVRISLKGFWDKVQPT